MVACLAGNAKSRSGKKKGWWIKAERQEKSRGQRRQKPLWWESLGASSFICLENLAREFRTWRALQQLALSNTPRLRRGAEKCIVCRQESNGVRELTPPPKPAALSHEIRIEWDDSLRSALRSRTQHDSPETLGAGFTQASQGLAPLSKVPC